MYWWNWNDPAFTLLFVSTVATAAIPVFLYFVARKSQELAQRSLDAQQRILKRQRRDELLTALPREKDPTKFNRLSEEIKEYSGADHRVLVRALRANPLQPLPYTVRNVDEARDYLTSFPVRCRRKESSDPFPDLLRFVNACGPEIGQELSDELVDILTGPSAVEQQPQHRFYRGLVSGGAWYLASPLLMSLEKISSREHGGLKLNVLTGVLQGVKDLDLGRPYKGRLVRPDDSTTFRDSLQSALAHILHRRNLSSFDEWSLEGSSQQVSTTVAWLIRAAGAGCGLDDWIDKRVVENLADCVTSIRLRIEAGS